MATNASIQSDRGKFQVMVVSPKGTTSSQLRQALKSLGFTQITAAASHMQALERTRGRNFTHIVFDAAPTDMPTLEFVTKVMSTEANCIMIALSEQPKIDDVFSLLRSGARSFLVPPFTLDSIEAILAQATSGPALSDAVLNSPDRNAAFTAVILNNLYRLSVSMRQAREFESAQREVRVYDSALRESVEMAQIFCEGSDENLRDKIIEGCINRAKDASTRLGRLRKKLKRERTDDGTEEETNPSAN